ncbi:MULTISPECIES: precorrin-6Y C5,15-methyltransferase (decarboxylating) subunit CbiT [Caproicibacterium]|uniref:Precorrin-6Y C5,15-methyltransferase (Decarboxylating) subunit CbiT n=1 Tax=Caproicibacterium argilliputei TaxID=3030016 RepID=A0AA97H262_9FIRM|nr:precorrin-6Y C5,15-methyltransferase (decarboxylating) subunit CbiT [Caproicibacterium argilliputei]WOC32415.1 precorrin-6Y C5,15-methyltransferase (decarboxylating) subunit CbiT [Caproicibacterium argilliputei]
MKRKVYLVGAGVGGRQGLTAEAAEVLARCGCVFGEGQLLETLQTACPKIGQTAPEKIQSYLDAHPQVQEAAVVFYGDPGFYGESERLRDALKDTCTVEGTAGVSCIAYFCARVGCTWGDAKLLSAETSPAQAVGAVRTNQRTLLLASRHCRVQDICALLCSGGLGGLQAVVGELLGTAHERILCGSAEELAIRKFSQMSVLLVENPEPVRQEVRTCIPDEAFFHSGVPMTKCEVRAVSVGKLQMHRDSVVYDIGCGTGSVSVECALQAKAGIVYAIDKNRAALHLTAQNRQKFGVYNVKPVEGEAPEVLRGLPAPDCVFIGGSTGNLPEILEEVLRKNPRVRLVLNAISLETVTQAIACMERFALADVDIAQISVAKSRPAGGHKLMQAQNPVYVISGQGNGSAC